MDDMRQLSERILQLFERGQVPPAKRDEARQLFRLLKQQLETEYQDLVARREHGTLNDIEAGFYLPALQDAWVNTIIISLPWDSRPSDRWDSALSDVSYYMTHWSYALKGTNKSSTGTGR